MSTKLGLQQDYILYCDTGRRSRSAVSLLQQKGFNARYLLNGMNGLGAHRRAAFLMRYRHYLHHPKLFLICWMPRNSVVPG